MKRNISDMLDDISVQDVELNGLSPLSSRRIKEITMKKVNGTYKRKRSLGIKVLIAAAIIASLSVTAFAAEKIFGAGDWFRDVLNANTTEQSALEAQVDYINKIGKVYDESIEDQGTILTPLACYGDENVCYLRLKITGPKGTVLSNDDLYTFYGSWEQEKSLLDNPELYTEHYSLPDADPKDNEKEFLVEVKAMPEAEQKLSDGSPIAYHIYGLYRQITVNGESDVFELALPGEFTLDLSNYNQVEMVNLDVDGLSYHREEIGILLDLEGNEQEIPYEYTVTFSSMEISPLSMSWICEYEISDPGWKVGAEIHVILKDGTEASVEYGRGSDFQDDSFAENKQSRFFTVPIDLNNVDHIIIGNPEQGESHVVCLPAGE